MKLEWIIRDPDVKTTVDAISDGLDARGAGHVDVVVQSVEESMRLGVDEA